MEDRQMHTVTCADCGQETKVPFKPSGDRPVYCRDCFAKRRNDRPSRGSSRGGDRQMHDATCTQCGQETQVPFKPTPGKPVLCRDCYRKNKSF